MTEPMDVHRSSASHKGSLKAPLAIDKLTRFDWVV